MGCMSFFLIGLAGFFILLGCSWFFYVRAVNTFTADAPVAIEVASPTEAEASAAQAKLDRFHEALREKQATTIAFTAADLNALIARNPDFARSRGKVRVTIADSVATMELSVPLDSAPFPRLKHRWFNGSTRMLFSYEDGDFIFDPQWIEANGNEVSGAFLRSFASSFSHSFTNSFEETLNRNGTAEDWRNVKSMALDGDQLIITTRGSPATSI